MIDILDISKSAKRAKKNNPKTIDATIGTFIYDDGKLHGFKTVKDVIKDLKEEEIFSYSSSSGGPEYEKAVLNTVFREQVKEISKNTKLGVIATPGGTGALYLSLALSLKPNQHVIIPSICWEPYINMAKIRNNEPIPYDNFNKQGGYNIDGFNNAAKKVLKTQDTVVTILNDPCNNPTGYTLSLDEFKDFINALKKFPKAVLIYDIAYASFCSEQDIFDEKLRILSMLDKNITVLLTFSASKTFCMYGMRVGALIIMNQDSEIENDLYNNAKLFARCNWSNVNHAGLSVLTKISDSVDLQKQFIDELKICQDILDERHKLLKENLQLQHINYIDTVGGFFLTIPCEKSFTIFEYLIMSDVYLIPLQQGLRISVASLSKEEIPKICEAIAKVMFAFK